MDQYYIDKLPSDIYNILKRDVINYLSALIIQKYAYKMFYNRYGIFWTDIVENFNDYFDYYCYLNDIVDPGLDYIDYYRE
jgi:hypothetical protein